MDYTMQFFCCLVHWCFSNLTTWHGSLSMWRRMQLLVRSCNHASHFVGHGSAGLLLLGKKRRVVRYGKPLQYTLAVESFCSCLTVLFGTVFVFLIWFTAIFFRGLMEGYAALWTANSWMSLARKLLPCFHFSSARSQVRGSSIY